MFKSSGASVLHRFCFPAHISSCIKSILSGVPEAFCHVPHPQIKPARESLWSDGWPGHFREGPKHDREAP